MVSMCRYKLAINWLNFTKICLAEVKILQKLLGAGDYASIFDQ